MGGAQRVSLPKRATASSDRNYRLVFLALSVRCECDCVAVMTAQTGRNMPLACRPSRAPLCELGDGELLMIISSRHLVALQHAILRKQGSFRPGRVVIMSCMSVFRTPRNINICSVRVSKRRDPDNQCSDSSVNYCLFFRTMHGNCNTTKYFVTLPHCPQHVSRWKSYLFLCRPDGFFLAASEQREQGRVGHPAHDSLTRQSRHRHTLHLRPVA